MPTYNTLACTFFRKLKYWPKFTPPIVSPFKIPIKYKNKWNVPSVWFAKYVRQPQNQPATLKTIDSLFNHSSSTGNIHTGAVYPSWALVWGKINKSLSLYTIQNILNVQNKYSESPQCYEFLPFKVQANLPPGWFWYKLTPFIKLMFDKGGSITGQQCLLELLK